MCARFSLNFNPRLFRAVFGFELPEQEFLPEFAPTDEVPVIVDFPTSPQIRMMRWGLIPSWSTSEKMSVNTFNARAESLDERPTFRGALPERRCLIPATCFYDWYGKQKLLIRPVELEMFAFAGLWEARRDLLSCTVITCSAHEAMTEFQDRMPVILDEQASNDWVKPGDWNPELLRTYPGQLYVEPAPTEQPSLFG